MSRTEGHRVEQVQKLVPVQQQPVAAATPLCAFGDPVTPSPLVFVRHHFDEPRIDRALWRLVVEGAVREPLDLGLRDMQAMPAERRVVVLECAGNGRTLMNPTPAGAAWVLGGASIVAFTGTPLRHLLDRAGIAAEAVEVAFTGADRGAVTPGGVVAFERSLPVATARANGPILAWEMNGEPLSQAHGAPLRLVVPGWYGVASVKWLTRIHVMTRPFHGHFQTEDYVFVGDRDVRDGTPLSAMRVRSVIARPAEGEVLRPGPVEIAGAAWSGAGPIERVDVSVDGERTWEPAELTRPDSPHAATTWRLVAHVRDPGTVRIVARAVDGAGHRQPLEPVWNARGYGNNVVHRVKASVGRAGG